MKERKERFIELISPIVYKHLCVIHWMENVSKEECIANIEAFSNIELLPKQPEFFYFWKEYNAEWLEVPIISQEYSTFDFNDYDERRQKVIDEFSKDKAMEIIKNRRSYTLLISYFKNGFRNFTNILYENSRTLIIVLQYVNSRDRSMS